MLRKILSGLFTIALLMGCSSISETGDLPLQKASNPSRQTASLCVDVSGIWLGHVADEFEGVAFTNPWGLILDQQGCELSGKLALNPDGPDIFCDINGNSLKCQYNAGEDCVNEVILGLEENKLSGNLNSCFSTESEVSLNRSSERELRELIGENIPAAFPANPHPEGCWLHSLYKEGYITIFCENFDDNSNNWPIGSGSGSLALTGTAIENGMLILDVSGFTADGEEASVVHFLPPMAFADDYLFQAAGKINSDSTQAAWGLAFEGEYSGRFLSKYIFLISHSGQYTLLKFENSQLMPILQPTENGAINKQSDNTITIVNDGSNYEFYVNGTLLENIQLPKLVDNGLMLAVFVAEGVEAEFKFDNLLIRSPRRD
jgi:hypothetical protein